MSEKKLCKHCNGTGTTSYYCCLKAIGAGHKYGMNCPNVKCCACNGTGEQPSNITFPAGW